MIKLYKATTGGVLYHEAWCTDSAITEHWGKLGDRGSTLEHALAEDQDAEDALEAVLAPARATGFSEIEDADSCVLLIEYRVDGMGSQAALSKRHALEDRLNEVLGWVGLGHCDGGSIGAGTMEVCCLVIDFELARTTIEADLAGSPFGDYSRIFDEAAG